MYVCQTIPDDFEVEFIFESILDGEPQVIYRLSSQYVLALSSSQQFSITPFTAINRTDGDWLAALVLHAEHLDGSGFPERDRSV